MATRTPVYGDGLVPQTLREMDAGLGDTLPSSLLPADTVLASSAQSITGVKTFTVPPVIPSLSGAQHTHQDGPGGGRLHPTCMTPEPAHPIVVRIADSAALANSALETNLSLSSNLPATTPAVGRVLRVTARGRVSSTGSPTLRLRLKAGAVVLRDSGAVTVTGAANAFWSLDAILVFRSIGVAGVLHASGTARVAGTDAEFVGTSPVVDTTAAWAVDLTGQWSAADPANTATLETWIVEELG